MTAAEAAPRLTLLAALCLGSAIFGLVQMSSASPYWILWAPLFRPLAWLGLAAGLVLAVAAALTWRRAARNRAAYAKTGLTRDDVHKLSPGQFEGWCAARLREQGYRVTEVGGQSDHGVDLIAEREGERLVVQCKRWLGCGWSANRRYVTCMAPCTTNERPGRW